MAEQSPAEARAVEATRSRRAFLAGTAGLTGAALATGVLGTLRVAADNSSAVNAAAPAAPPPGPPDPEQGATDARLVGNDFFLILDGETGSALRSVDNGVISADVVNEKLGGDHIAKKHIAGVKYEDISFSMGFDQPSPMYSWLQATMVGKAQRRDGGIIGATHARQTQSQLGWTNGLISEIGFPALDATAKDAAKMTIKVTPETTKILSQGGSVANPKVQKKWLPANFRLRIDGLDDACSKVNKIEALVIKQKLVDNADGTPPVPAVDIPNLVITLPESAAQPFIDWHQSFVIDGKNSDNDERNGSLTYFATDGTTLGQLSFQNLGIVQVANDPTDQKIRRVKAEMYCEHMVAKFG